MIFLRVRRSFVGVEKLSSIVPKSRVQYPSAAVHIDASSESRRIRHQPTLRVAPMSPPFSHRTFVHANNLGRIQASCFILRSWASVAHTVRPPPARPPAPCSFWPLVAEASSRIPSARLAAWGGHRKDLLYFQLTHALAMDPPSRLRPPMLPASYGS